MSIQTIHSGKWNYKGLAAVFAITGLLLYILFSNLNDNIFSFIDKKAFRFLNGFIESSSFWQNFWAMANHRVADWIEDVCFALFFCWVITATPAKERRGKIAECIFILFYVALLVIFSKRIVFGYLLDVQRKSPTLLMDGFTNMADKASWLKVKFKSPKSFPGDHAVTALSFISGFLYLGRKRFFIALAATCYGIFLCLPRMIAGAHWLSDVLIGSGSIVAIAFSLAFLTPLASFCIEKIESLITPRKYKETAV